MNCHAADAVHGRRMTVSCYAQKLIEDSPHRVPGVWSRALAFEPSPAAGMKL
jgi:hypothetical protein